jgi:hypothetical protein
LKHVEGADVGGQPVGEKHSSISVPLTGTLRRRQDASTTRSMRMKRDPFTSSVVSGPQARAHSAASSVLEAFEMHGRRCRRRTAAFAGISPRQSSRRCRGAWRTGRPPGMQFGGTVAQFAHVAHDQQAASRLRSDSTSMAAASNPGWRCRCRR